MMEERDWLGILRLIQAELRGIGLTSIAELSGYDEETYEGRRTYGARKRLCCANRSMAGLPLIPDRPILRPL
jgi:hypothetical protein